MRKNNTLLSFEKATTHTSSVYAFSEKVTLIKRYLFLFLMCIASAYTHHAYSQVFAYVPNSLSDNVSVINTTTNAVTATINVGARPLGVCVSPNGSRVYITNFNGNTVSVINTATNTVIATINVGTNPSGVSVSPNGATVYVVNGSGNVSVIDVATNTIIATIGVGITPRGIAISSNGSTLYVGNSASGTVSVINTATNTITAAITVGTTPFGIAISPDGSKIYVVNIGSDNVSVINTATNVVSATISVGASPRCVSVTPDGSKVYVTCFNSDNVSVIDAATNTVTTNITVSGSPLGVSVSPNSLQAYVTGFNSGSVSVINTTTDVISTAVAVQAAPYGFGNMMAINYCPTITISPTSSTLSGGTIGSGYSQTLTQSGLTGTATWSVIGALPAGLSIASASGVISGTPTATGTFNFTAQVTNGTCTRTKAYSIVVTCPTVTITPNPTTQNYVVGTPISITLSASGVTGAGYTYALTSGALPAGVSLASGVISGTPTTAIGSTSFTITATSSIGACTGTAIYNYSVACPPLTFGTTTTIGAIISVPYSINSGVTGNTATVTYSVSPALPTGLSISASGVISGTPTAVTASNTYVVTATQGTCGVTRGYTFAVTCPTVTVTPASTTQSFIVGTPISITLGAGGVTGATYTYALTSGTLPAGVSLAGGVISGTPTAVVASASITITATSNIGGCTGTAVYNYSVVCPTFVFNSTTASGATVGTAYNINGGVTGNTATVVYGVSGALPAGLSFNTSSGVISGTPTTVTASATYTVTATQGTCTATQNYTFAVNAVACPIITFANTTVISPNAVINSAYSLNGGATVASGTLIYSVLPALPAGLSINASGVISGTPTVTTASATYTVTATQGACSATQNYTFAVNAAACPIITFANTTIISPNAVINSAYSLNGGATVASGTLTYGVLPALPAGLSINASGLISGTPTVTTASATYTVTATQGACSATRNYTFAVICPTIIFTNTTAPSGVIGVAYTFNAGATGNTATLTYSVSPTLPAGLSINASGLISGTPTVSVLPTTYTVTATQGTCNATQGYTFGVNCSGFAITPTTLPNGLATIAYNQTLTTNLTSPLTWSILPALPAGISLNTSTGVISGTSAVVVASVTYTISASNGTCNVSQSYNLAFLTPCSAVVLNPNLLALPSATLGVPYSLTMTATGGTTGAIYSYTTLTPMPEGLTFVNGFISGTPKFSTSVTFTVIATTTPNNCVGTSVYTLVVNPNPATSVDSSLANLVKVSPNPSSNDFNVDFGGINMAKSSVRVYDAQGKTVYASDNNSNLITISLDKFAAGIYLLEVETSKGRITKRLAKQ